MIHIQQEALKINAIYVVKVGIGLLAAIKINRLSENFLIANEKIPLKSLVMRLKASIQFLKREGLFKTHSTNPLNVKNRKIKLP